MVCTGSAEQQEKLEQLKDIHGYRESKRVLEWLRDDLHRGFGTKREQRVVEKNSMSV